MAHKYAKVASKKMTKVTSKDFSRESYRLDPSLFKISGGKHLIKANSTEHYLGNT